MAGHNKWSKIKRKKAGNDAKRSKIWARITRDILIAAREGGGSVDMNPRLALAVDKAKGENMPKDNIERAIKRGTGEIEGADYEEGTFEGYAPGGIAIFVETLTDNNNRTVADVRSLFSKAGGNLGQDGSVAFLFEQKAVFEVPTSAIEEDDLFLLVADAGAEDLRREDGDEETGDVFVIEAETPAFGAIQDALASSNIEPSEASLQRIPTTTTALDPSDAAKVLRLLEALDDLQDVQAVYSTLEMTDEALASLEG
ncbi:MAG: YebC/PmpR family DNA-binding transcriptional regulator [Rubricoccaceae bacterium]